MPPVLMKRLFIYDLPVYLYADSYTEINFGSGGLRIITWEDVYGLYGGYSAADGSDPEEEDNKERALEALADLLGE